jgi:hypothetical protein
MFTPSMAYKICSTISLSEDPLMEQPAYDALPPTNPVTLSARKMTRLDKHAVRLLLTRLSLESEKNSHYMVKVSDLARHWGVDDDDEAETLASDVVDRLLMLTIVLETQGGWTVFPWFSDVRFVFADAVTGCAVIAATFNDKVKSYLLALARHHTFSLRELLAIT